MKLTKILMGMPITVHIVDAVVKQKDIDEIFNYFISIDKIFSTYKETSEISRINNGSLQKDAYSNDMKKIFTLAEQTKKETNGYFDMQRDDLIDPSGLVKGWAIQQASELLKEKNLHNFFIEAGGDIQVSGLNEKGESWKVGIRNPFNRNEYVKVLVIKNKGVATSGTTIRGQHIYNPHNKEKSLTDIVSITIVAENIYDADRFATAAFAMGEEGINFVESHNKTEGYMIDKHGIATYTSGFEEYVA